MFIANTSKIKNKKNFLFLKHTKRLAAMIEEN